MQENTDENLNTDQRQQLGSLLSAIHANTYEDKLEVNRGQLQYAIYLRKSTENADRQQKSIGDQFQDIKERCLEPNKITRYTVIKEEKSAKESGVRQGFNKMIADFNRGKYQGLIAWDCSRLARNMREAGEIIDMLDKGRIKDLLFPTAYFDNSASGKMLLGMSFVLAKQYSEHLSENVLRGYRHRINEGRYLGKLVHGYRIMEDGLLEPDDENFLIIQQAFYLRLNEHKTLEEIMRWLNKQNYMQCFGREQERSRTNFTTQKLSEMFRDAIYAGFMRYGQTKPVDMTECYDFEPIISAEEYMKLNKVDSIEGVGMRGNVLKRDIQADILRNMVHCSYCKNKMYPTTGTGNHKRTTYVYFRCDNKACPYKLDEAKNPKGKKHQFRANKVIYAAFDILKQAQFDLKKAYAQYLKAAQAAIEQEKIELLSEERRSRADLTETKTKLESVKLVVADPRKADVAPYYQEDIKQYIERDIPTYELNLADIARRRANLKDTLLTEERFLKLMENIGLYLSKITELKQIDEIIRKFFSNFIVQEGVVSVYEFTPEWRDALDPTWQG